MDGQTVREFEIELADDPESGGPTSTSAPLARQDRPICRRPPARGFAALRSVTQADEIWAADEVYRERTAPQFHFTPRRGWNNDPNGLVYCRGRVSPLLPAQSVRLELGQHALGPRRQPRPGALAGTADRDLSPSSSATGLLRQRRRGRAQHVRLADEARSALLVAAYTSTGRGECIAYSATTAGVTWTEFEGNPVVKHQGRDPRLLWHEPTKRWVMAVYDETEGQAVDRVLHVARPEDVDIRAAASRASSSAPTSSSCRSTATRASASGC